jgi:hypothetical protein
MDDNELKAKGYCPYDDKPLSKKDNPGLYFALFGFREIMGYLEAKPLSKKGNFASWYQKSDHSNHLPIGCLVGNELIGYMVIADGGLQLACNGVIVSKKAYPELYDAIGDSYTLKGTPDDMFGLPDLRIWKK